MRLVCLLLACLCCVPALADDTGATSLTVPHWLVLGPFDAPLPALANDDTAHTVGVAELLAQPPLAVAGLVPREKQQVMLPGGGPAAWQGMFAPIGLESSRSTSRWAVMAAYVTAPQFTKAKLAVKACQPFTAWVDGQKVCGRDKADSTSAAVSGDVKLTQGKHVLIVYTLTDPAGPTAWTAGATITAPVALASEAESFRNIRIGDYLDTEAVSGLQLSPAGDLVAISYRRPEVPADFADRWLEIRRAKDGTLVRTLRGDQSGSFQWAGAGQAYSFTTDRDGKSTLWLDDVAGGPARTVLKDIEHFGGVRWLPGGKAFLYTLDEERGKDPAGFKRMRGLTDRWSGSRNVGSLYLAAVDGGASRRLTAGRASCEVQDVSFDGKRILFTRTLYDDAKFPFEEGELYELDLASLAAEKVLVAPRGVSALYGPTAGKLLLKAGPSAFGGVGNTVPAGRIPNDYDSQLFVLDRKSGAVEPITRDFNPSIGSFVCSPKDGRVYATATDTTCVGLYCWDPAGRKWSSVAPGVEVTKGLELSADGSRLAWYGEDAMTPERVFTLDVAHRGAHPVQVAAPAADDLADVVLGEHETWDFTAGSGTRILGDVYYPPGFSDHSDRRWPCIVFYYGGTSPVSRDFGGRYPKNLWAAHGYVVYVLQPSGATGFGQEFSARHVNDWGRTSADEIIEGTQKFLAAHPAVDPQKVGCIGASYGGFMTELLQTKTDIFAAAISHAGISSLHSYWGEGWWGYTYSSVATSGSYPWNQPELYVEQSPLFHADRIRTPLLLLHGAADTNVPVGESEQLYTALRILGKPVEFIKVDGQNHWILNYPQRVIWMETIIAWFDKQLKGQSGWWDDLYGDSAR